MTRPIWKKKTKALRRAMKKLGHTMVDIRMPAWDTVDLRGMIAPGDEPSDFFTTGACRQLVEDRRIGSHRLHEEVPPR